MLIHTAVIKHVPPQPFISYKSISRESAHIANQMQFIIHKQSTPYTCAAACIKTLMNYYNLNNSESEEDIAKQLNTTPENGAHPSNVISYLKSNGWDIQSYVDEGSPKEWTDFQIFLDWYLMHNTPIMVEHGYPDSHWYLIIGYNDDDTLVISDPWTGINGGRLVINARDFFNTWYDTKLGTNKVCIAAKPPKNIN